MKPIFATFLFGCLLSHFAMGQVDRDFKGYWEGSYIIKPRSGKVEQYKIAINFEYNVVTLRDAANQLIAFEDYSKFARGSSDISMIQDFLVVTSDGIKSPGRMIYTLKSPNLLKLSAEFVPTNRNSAGASMNLERYMGNFWLRDRQIISAKAVTISATEIDDFHMGGAIIRKGESFAVIDKEGKLFIPWGKYKFNQRAGVNIDKLKCGFYNGFSIVRDPETEKYGFVNVRGELVAPCIYVDAKPFGADGFAWVKQIAENGEQISYFVRNDGKRFRIKPGMIESYLQRDEPVYCLKNGNAYEYYHKSGRFIFKTRRRVAGPYSDGLIRVDTTYELAGTKTGFIDTLDRLIIPYRKERFGDFHSGFVKVTASTMDEFQFAYLNKKNQLAIKLKPNDEMKSIYAPTDFMPFKPYAKEEGSIAWVEINHQLSAITPDGLIHMNVADQPEWSTLQDLRTRAYGKPGEEQSYFNIEGRITYDVADKFTPGGVGPSNTYTLAKSKTITRVGRAIWSGSLDIAPIFTMLGPVDVYSELSRATYLDEESHRVTDGYVDRQGKFMIINVAN